MRLLRAASIFIKGFLMLKASSPQLIRVFVDNDSVVEKLVRSHSLEELRGAPPLRDCRVACAPRNDRRGGNGVT